MKRHKQSQSEKCTDPAASKGACASSRGNGFPPFPPDQMKNGWGDQNPPDKGGIDVAGGQEKPAVTGTESAGVLDVHKAHPALFDQGQVLYSEFCFRGLLPKASSLCVDDINSYQLTPSFVLPGECPE